MKKLINKKHEDGENGVAIVFSLIMLVVFFLIAFGFVSTATNAKLASSLRLPAAQAALSNSETVLNEALYAIDKKLINNGFLDQSLLKDLNFSNGANTVSLKMWATKSSNTTNITNAFPLQLATTDFTPTSSADFGWITASDLDGDGNSDRYAWMVIPSDGIDANYIGKTGKRTGHYARDMDVTQLAASFENGVFIDWTDNDGSGPYVNNFWDSKKDLITSLSADIDIAIANLEVNTTPVPITKMSTNRHDNTTARYDLSNDPTGNTTADLTNFINQIPWLKDANAQAYPERDEVAANIKDFIDSDNEATAIPGGGVGNERVPYINEVQFKVINQTLPSDGTNVTDTKVDISINSEFCNMFSNYMPEGSPTGSVDSWGDIDGTNAKLEIMYTILVIRGNTHSTVAGLSAILDVNFTSPVGTPTGYINLGSDYSSLTVGNSTDANNVEVHITVQRIRLIGGGTLGSPDEIIWDTTKGNLLLSSGSSGEISGDNSGAGGDAKSVSFEVANPRDNYDTGWAATAWSIATAGSLGSANTNISSPEGETGEPHEWSTAHMPEGGQIKEFAELGMCARNDGKTLNFTDYNHKDPAKLAGDYPGNLDLSDPMSFDGGDRSLLDYLTITNPGSKTPTSTIPSYQQFGAINPNTSNEEVIKLLLSNVNVMIGPKYSTAVESPMVNRIASKFPGKEAIAGSGFKFDQFHQTTSNNHHNRNPTTYGYAFSTKHPTAPILPSDIPDALREALVLRTMKLVSPKYSYFTVLCAVDLLNAGGTSLGTVSKIRAFIRFDNESRTFKVLQKSETN
jgi:hypothetical protein